MVIITVSIPRLISIYSCEASKLNQLTDTVLAHHNKNPQHFAVMVTPDKDGYQNINFVQVEGEEVKILPKSEEDRFPKVVPNLTENQLIIIFI